MESSQPSARTSRVRTGFFISPLTPYGQTKEATMKRKRKYVMREANLWSTAYNPAPASPPLTDVLSALVGGPRAEAIAGELLRRFRDVRGLTRAGPHELMSVQGVGARTASRLQAAIQFAQAYLTPEAPLATISSPADVAALMQPRLAHRDQEYLYVLLLDTRNQVIGDPVEVYHGSLNASLIRVSEVFREAIKANAASIILVHNHPSGLADPSPEDIAVSRTIIEIGKQLDIEVADHLILGCPGWVSLRNRGGLDFH
jgi:DNA repair protein RadC